MPSLQVEREAVPLASALARHDLRVSLHWLGQAGFALKYDDFLVLIDPYLSDALAAKYAGKAFPHTRMMPTPIGPEELAAVNLVLITHRHGDHLDRPTLSTLAQHSPQCTFVLPAAERHLLSDRGIADDCIIGVDAGQHWQWGPLSVHPVPAAHETVERDENDHCRFLGYVLGLGGVTLYHSGDSIPFPELDAALSPHAIDVALLPVNGRDAMRTSMGVPGNFELEEAIDLCRRHEITTMIAHHFGMFAFNTIAPDLIERAAHTTADVAIHAAKVHTRYDLVAAVTETRVMVDAVSGRS